MFRAVLISILIVALGLTGSSAALAGPRMQEDMPDQEPPPDDAAPPPAAPAPDPSVPWWNWRLPPGSFQTFGPLFEYQSFWQKRTEILAHPDSFELELLLGEIMDGDVFQSEKNFLHQLTAQGRAQVVEVDLNPVVVFASDDDSVIIDEYVDRSYLVDLRSRQPVGDGPDVAPETVKMAFRMHRFPTGYRPNSFAWKVIDSVRAAN
jgi:hypothetical protein